MQELIDILIQFSGWLLVLILYIILGIIMGNRMSRLFGQSDDLRWLSLGIVLALFVAYPATFYLYYAMQAAPK